MARKASNLICKCGRRGGFITKRKAGYGLTNEYYYVGHYDPVKKGRKWCSITDHDLAHISFDDLRYLAEYMPLVHRLLEIYRTGSKKEKDEIFEKTALLLYDMVKISKRLRAEIVVAKVFADKEELIMLDKIKEAEGVGLTNDHNVLSRSLRGLPVTPQRLWENHPHYKNWPKREHRKCYQPIKSGT